MFNIAGVWVRFDVGPSGSPIVSSSALSVASVFLVAEDGWVGWIAVPVVPFTPDLRRRGNALRSAKSATFANCVSGVLRSAKILFFQGKLLNTTCRDLVKISSLPR